MSDDRIVVMMMSINEGNRLSELKGGKDEMDHRRCPSDRLRLMVTSPVETGRREHQRWL